MKNLILIATLFFVSINVFCQTQFTTVSGKILDNLTKEVIPYAAIQIERTSIGTITNIDGEFELRIPQKCKSQRIVVSRLGYVSDTIEIKSVLTIKMKLDLFNLDEVVVKPLDAIEVLKKAITKIPENYTTSPINMNTFYRALTKEDTTYINIVEAVCNFHYAPYNDTFNIYKAQTDYYKNTFLRNCTWAEGFNNYFDLYTSPNDQLKIVESRISEYNSKNVEEIFVIGSPLSLIANDKTKFLNDFMDQEHFKHYSYKIKGSTLYNNNEVVIISFKPKRIQFRNHNPGPVVNRKKYFNAEFEGEMFIDRKTYAFIRFDYHSVKVRAHQRMQPKLHQVIIDYKNFNGKWYLSQITKQRSDNVYKKSAPIDSLTIEEQLIVNQVEKNDVNKFEQIETVPYSTYFTLNRYATAYNKEFWDKYNILTYNKLSQKATEDLQRKKTLEQQFFDMQSKNDSMPQPVAMKIDSSFYVLDTKIVDEYKWLENKNDENTIDYIRNENRYTYNYFVPLRNLQNDLLNKMMQRQPKRKSSDSADVYIIGDYTYYYRYNNSDDSPVITRKKVNANTKEELVLDLTIVEEKYDYFEVCDTKISPDNKYIALAYDTIGSERYQCCIYEIGEQNPIKQVPNYWGLEWANDSGKFFYVKQSPNGTPADLFKCNLESKSSADLLIYHENDKQFDVYIEKSQFDNYIFVRISSMNQTEYRYINLNDKNQELKIFYPREKGHSYTVKESENSFYILSNKNAVNNRLFETSLNKTSFGAWNELIANRTDTLLNNFYVTKDYLVLNEIAKAQNIVSVLNLTTFNKTKITFNEKLASVFVKDFEYNSDTILLKLTTFNEPEKIYKYSLSTNKKLFYKQNKIEGYNPNDYKTELVWANAKDGSKVPISLVYHKNIKLNGKNPLLLEAYGSYGTNNFPQFSIDKLSLLQRGVIYAIAHVRGSSMLGNQWHQNGMLLNKKNTFNDYIASARYLIDNNYTQSNLLFAVGGSAGGMLMGVVANETPELFKGIILEYPAVCTFGFLKDSDNNVLEFGDPFQSKPDFENIMNYSPYENVKEQSYPAMLFISGLNDLRVKYWNATKMVARLRNNNKNANPILLKTLPTGHTGGSGRYSYCREMAFEYSFILSLIKEE